MNALIEKSPNASKKYRVTFHNGKHVDFGGKGYEDYTMHKDHERRKKYIIRHQKREDWKDPYTAGFWSRWLLWEKPTLKSSAQFIQKHFGIRIHGNI